MALINDINNQSYVYAINSSSVQTIKLKPEGHALFTYLLILLLEKREMCIILQLYVVELGLILLAYNYKKESLKHKLGLHAWIFALRMQEN